MDFSCSKCGRRENAATRAAKCGCGGLWSLAYEPTLFDLSRVDRAEWGMFRYREFLPLAADNWRKITLGEGMTPVIRLDEDVLLKMDYFMPTLSFKDRGAAVLIAHCLQAGIRSVVMDSSGNAGNSVAAYSARAGIDCEIFVPQGTSPAKIAMIRAHGARVRIVDGSRDMCADVCRDEVEKRDAYYASHVYNPFFFQGTKTYIYEVYEQLGRIPRNVFVPLGNGTLFLGIVMALEHLLKSGVIHEIPRVVAVQSERCAPIARAAAGGLRQPERITPLTTLAEGIAIGAPARGEEILQSIYRHNMRVVTAPEEAIPAARELLAHNGIYCEHTTAATYAAYLKLTEEEGRLPDSLIPMCGAGLKSDH